MLFGYSLRLLFSPSKPCSRFVTRYLTQDSLLSNETVKSFLKTLSVDESFDTFSHVLANNLSTSYLASQRSAIFSLCSTLASSASELRDLETLITESGESELGKLALSDLEVQHESLLTNLFSLVEICRPSFGADINEVCLELSAGVGGQEAMIWVKDLFAMYELLCPSLGLSFQPLSVDMTDIGGLRSAQATVSGNEAYKLLRFEGGVHRVQRVPKTETKGRIHTSTAAVVVAPVPSEIQVAINASDLTITTYRSSGPGGQHVNRTDSAVRIIHNPTGIIVTCQEERSQHKNRELAMSKLRSILYEREIESQMSQERANRRVQVGTRARSEKIRTYNWPRHHVNDHRLSSDVPGTHDLHDTMKGGQTLVNIIQALQKTDLEDRLLSLAEDYLQ